MANRPNPKPALLPQRLRHVFNTDWSSDAAAPPAFWKQQQRMFDKATVDSFNYQLRFKIQKISHLQVFAQRYVYSKTGAILLQGHGCHRLAIALEHCQRYNSYQEILATLNAIIMRVQKLAVPVNRHLRALAIHYASLVFSAAAMKPHLEDFSILDRNVRGRYSAALMDSLCFAFDALDSPGSQEELASMRRLIGPLNECDELEPHSLHKLLFWNDFAAQRRREVSMPLLAKLGMDHLLDSVWEMVKGSVLTEQNLSPIYRCVIEMVKNGNSSKALEYMRQLSSMFGGSLPSISQEKNLNVLLDDQEIGEALPRLAGEKERLSILEDQIRMLEKRLGVYWDPEKSAHVGFSDPDCNATEQPLFDMDGESPGYDSSERLVAEVMALGCSKSMEDLGKIADLLDDQEGQMIPISTPNRGFEFAWYPERSPTELVGSPSTPQNDKPNPWPVACLGLKRIRLVGNQVSPAQQYPLCFIPLGRLFMRTKRNELPALNSKEDWQYKWGPTKYIIGWERFYGRFVLVYPSDNLGIEGRRTFMNCASFVPMAGCLNENWKEPWVISALQQPMEKSYFKGVLEVDPGWDLVE